MIQLIQLASDNFTRANENPLSQGGKWSVNSAPNPLQIVSDACEVATLSASCVETYTGQALPNDQYTSITIKSLIAGNFPQAQIYARSNGGVLFSTLTAYELLLSISSSALILYAWVNGTRTVVVPNFSVTIGAGDVWTLVPLGTTIYIFQNGAQVTSATDSTVTSGSGGIGAASFTSAADIVLSNFVVGKAAIAPLPPNYYSEPDCRLHPNASRNVNGTLIYDVQTSSNPAIPPTDSRKAGAPVASGTYPQNSRSPGTYGPEE